MNNFLLTANQTTSSAQVHLLSSCMRSYALILVLALWSRGRSSSVVIFYVTLDETNFSRPFLVRRHHKVQGNFHWPCFWKQGQRKFPRIVVTRYMEIFMNLVPCSHKVHGNFYVPLLERSHKIHRHFHECIVITRFMEIPVYPYLNIFTSYMEISINVATRHMEIYM